MIITIVEFRAYDTGTRVAFIDKTFQEVHEFLNRICNTYEPTSIWSIDTTKLETHQVTFPTLNHLTGLRTETKA